MPCQILPTSQSACLHGSADRFGALKASSRPNHHDRFYEPVDTAELSCSD